MASEIANVKVAIIGAGNMAREHARVFADIPGVSLAGIHSRTRTHAEAVAREFNIANICDSADELYERTRADLVVITVFELAMKPVSVACFAYPWALLLEKPAGYNMQDAYEISAAADENGSKAYVALNRRCLSSTMAALDNLDLLGGPRFIRIQDQQDQAAALAAGQPPAVVENWMYANSIHVIDYFRIFGRGEPGRVEPILPWNPRTPGTVVAKIEFDSGDVGLYEGIWNGPGPWAVSVSTPERRWEMRPLEQACFQNKGERKLHSVEVHPWDREFKPGFRLQAEMAVKAAM
ncbi:MAG: Gfo/Idh/MocA family oxidoreductase, partial [Desulforhabdus sp.]|nr:Gfo/Idh/MocA family oxidoreductase [Desulforhabdus sp.]